MKPTILAVLMAAMLVLFVRSVYAQGDLEPPVLADLLIEPGIVDTSNSSQVITFTARFTDDLSGFSGAWLIFSPLVPTAQQRDVNFFERDRVSGDAWDGVYLSTAILPHYAAEGRWNLDIMQISDVVGNLFNSRVGSEDWPDSYNYHFANVVDTTPTPTITPTETRTPLPTATIRPTSTPWPTSTSTATPTPTPTATSTPAGLYVPMVTSN